ncbi:MAG: glycosyltransferase family 2 protein [Butyrivibrio sp.]|nr:glycosyltransferase family 2 protein [Butyrivibrio sp.]
MSNKVYEKGLVSVITPVYNAEKYLKETIESVINQTYKNIELILVDDQSVDKSASIINKYLVQNANIVYYQQPNNMGAGVARNKGLELARGQYIAFLDADDVWEETKIEKQIHLMGEKKASFCYTAISMIDENGVLKKEKRNVNTEVDYHFLLSNTMIATSSVLIDRAKVGDFKMSTRRGGQDYATWLQLLKKCDVAYGINESLVKYRVLPDSLSSNKLKSIKQLWEIQTQDEGISKYKAIIHICNWCINVIKKYYM